MDHVVVFQHHAKVKDEVMDKIIMTAVRGLDYLRYQVDGFSL